MTYRLISGPTVSPVSVAEAKAQVRVLGNAEDEWIAARIAAATEIAEHRTGRTLIAQTWKLVLYGFPPHPINWQYGHNPSSLVKLSAPSSYSLHVDIVQFEKSPVLSVLSVNYRDDNGLWQTVDKADYVVDLGDQVQIRPALGKSWPSVGAQPGAVEIIFRAGYATPCLVSATFDTLAADGLSLAVGDPVRLSNVGEALPEPLRLDADYYVESIQGTGLYKLAATAGGAAIDLTSDGTGTTLIGQVPEAARTWICAALATMYRDRELFVDTRKIAPIPFYDGLLDSLRVYLG